MKSFEQILKDEQDLITKDFCYSSPFEIRSSIDLKEAEFVNRFQQTRTDGLMLLSGLNFPLPLNQGFEGNLKLQRSSQGLSKVKLMVSQVKELYKTTALLQHQMVQHGMFLKSKPQIGLSFTSDKINLETRLKGNPFIMDLSLTSQVQSYVMGLSLKLAVNSQKYTEYALALGKTTENFRILAKHCSNEFAFGTLYIYKMIRFGKHTQAASIIRTKWASKDTHMQVGVRHESDDMIYKVKIDSIGRTAVVINKKVNELFDVSVSADVDLKEITSSRVGDYNLGVLINFKYKE